MGKRSVAVPSPGVAGLALVAAGVNSAEWNPALVVNVPAQAVAGLYTGTVNHSVA
ncbi:hypothetical protein [Microbispora rosea]|uniref:hypothetical protein n=1 Tax=Microbispora rosea TaxID=58117 RepID=UPI00343C4BEE